MLLPKFVITMEGILRMGMVAQHKDLLLPGEQSIGGGYYRIDPEERRIIMDRSSYDFGKPLWHLLKVLHVPSKCRGMEMVYVYDDSMHEAFNVSDELRIEYYE